MNRHGIIVMATQTRNNKIGQRKPGRGRDSGGAGMPEARAHMRWHPDRARSRHVGRDKKTVSARGQQGQGLLYDENIKIKRHIREPHRQAKGIHSLPETLSWVDRSVAPLAMVLGYHSRQGRRIGMRSQGIVDAWGCFGLWPVNSLTSMVGPFGQISGLLGYYRLYCDVV
ncbi:hypothetical protein PENSUB_9427 [Penicillium subrubescens]|uniref:Uncharacterized protein n=1 Tax=Penicillium subrubescens TaxID=1316194 RepID=A0A1Q5TDQ1_9EURO|nr:hypothetical protein PENSUB_9427 [Penicillium subrubescens]